MTAVFRGTRFFISNEKNIGFSLITPDSKNPIKNRRRQNPGDFMSIYFAGYAPMPKELIHASDKLKRSDILITSYLIGRLPSVFPKVSQICRDLKMHPSTVFRSLNRLNALNILKRTRFYRQPNLYRFNPRLLSKKMRTLHESMTEISGLKMAQVARIAGAKYYNARRLASVRGYNKTEAYLNTDTNVFKNRKRNSGPLHIAAILHC